MPAHPPLHGAFSQVGESGRQHSTQAWVRPLGGFVICSVCFWREYNERITSGPGTCCPLTERLGPFCASGPPGALHLRREPAARARAGSRLPRRLRHPPTSLPAEPQLSCRALKPLSATRLGVRCRGDEPSPLIPAHPRNSRGLSRYRLYRAPLDSPFPRASPLAPPSFSLHGASAPPPEARLPHRGAPRRGPRRSQPPPGGTAGGRRGGPGRAAGSGGAWRAAPGPAARPPPPPRLPPLARALCKMAAAAERGAEPPAEPPRGVRPPPPLGPEEVARRLASTSRELSNRRKILLRNLPAESSSQVRPPPPLPPAPPAGPCPGWGTRPGAGGKLSHRGGAAGAAPRGRREGGAGLPALALLPGGSSATAASLSARRQPARAPPPDAFGFVAAGSRGAREARLRLALPAGGTRLRGGSAPRYLPARAGPQGAGEQPPSRARPGSCAGPRVLPCPAARRADRGGQCVRRV